MMKRILRITPFILITGCSFNPYIQSPDLPTRTACEREPGLSQCRSNGGAPRQDVPGKKSEPQQQEKHLGDDLAAANGYLMETRDDMEGQAFRNSDRHTQGNTAILLGSTVALGAALFKGSQDLIVGAGAAAGLGSAAPAVYAPDAQRKIYFTGVTALDCVRSVSFSSQEALRAIEDHAFERKKLKNALRTLAYDLELAYAKQTQKGIPYAQQLKSATDRAVKRYFQGVRTLIEVDRFRGMERPLAAETRMAVDRIRNEVNKQLSDGQVPGEKVLALSQTVVEAGLKGLSDSVQKVNASLDALKASPKDGTAPADPGKEDAKAAADATKATLADSSLSQDGVIQNQTATTERDNLTTQLDSLVTSPADNVGEQTKTFLKHVNSSNLSARDKSILTKGANEIANARTFKPRIRLDSSVYDIVGELEYEGQWVDQDTALFSKPLDAIRLSAKDSIKTCGTEENKAAAAVIPLSIVPEEDITLPQGESRNFLVKNGKGPYTAMFLGAQPAHMTLAPPVSRDGTFTVTAANNTPKDQAFTLLIMDHSSNATVQVAGKTAAKSAAKPATKPATKPAATDNSAKTATGGTASGGNEKERKAEGASGNVVAPKP